MADKYRLVVEANRDRYTESLFRNGDLIDSNIPHPEISEDVWNNVKHLAEPIANYFASSKRRVGSVKLEANFSGEDL